MGLRFHTFIYLVLLSILSLGSCFKELNTKADYMKYLQQHSSYPSFQVFYNRHFKKSRQFQDFIEVIEDVEAKVKEYAKIIFTDCDEAFGEGFTQCQDIMDNNENRLTVGLKPNSKFLSLSGKLLQRNPGEIKYNHPLDVYTVSELVQFIEGLVPSYLVDVVSKEEYDEFLKPRYSVKTIYFTKQDEVPLNIKKLSTIFHKRIDFARIQDLSQELISKHNIIHFPTLLVLKYNYEDQKFDQIRYVGPHFDIQGLLKMKQFLQTHAAKEPRNDLLFHSIKMQVNNQIKTVNSSQQKNRILDTVSGLVWVEESSTLKYLPELQSKYTDFFNYIHILNPEKGENVEITLFNTEHQRVEQVVNNQFPHLQFNGLEYKPLLSNITFFMQKNYSVIVVPKQYGYFCPIINKQFFQGIANCFIGNDDALEELKKQTGEFQYGVVAYQTADMEKSKFSGNVIKDAAFETVYKTLEEAVKIKLESEIKNYLDSPVLQITDRVTVFSQCADPRRKCVVAFLDPSKAIAFKAEQGYLKDIAQQYYSDYRIYWTSLTCNKDLLESLGEQKASLIVINPITNKFQSLKQKITKSILIKFLKKIKVDTKREKHIDLAERFNPCLENQENIQGEL